MKKFILALSAALTFSAAVNATDGKTLYTQKLCATCHGAEGKAPIAPMYPKLNGQNAAYLVTQMKDIKSGKRNNGMSMTMKPMMGTVSEAEMTAIADYLAGLK